MFFFTVHLLQKDPALEINMAKVSNADFLRDEIFYSTPKNKDKKIYDSSDESDNVILSRSFSKLGPDSNTVSCPHQFA